jgi:hypothetical protein
MTIRDKTTNTVYATLADAINQSNAGDTINVTTGSYSEDIPKIFHDLTIQGTFGLAQLESVGQPTNGEAALVQDTTHLTLSDLEISGVTVPTDNGAAVRFETGNVLTLTNDWFHDNQDGVLTGPITGATVDISNSEFNNNGIEDGQTHNIYIGVIQQLNITGSYFHDALGGHEIKSRALNNSITDSRIQDGATADTSFSVDLPNGGNAIISGNTIEKGPNSPQGAIIHYGGELNPVPVSSSLTITDNVIIDDDTMHTPLFVFNQSTDAMGQPVVPIITNNTFYGVTEAELSNLPVDESGNTFLPIGEAPTLDTSHPFSTVPCLVRGTRIAILPGKEKAIEDIRIGDWVMVLRGGAKRVKWIGHRSYDAATVARNLNLRPVVICKDAVGKAVPRRDLVVSPGHALYVDGLLVQAAALVNGKTIHRREADIPVEYFHLELQQHDVIFAEGMPVESYLDLDNRHMFDNAHEYGRNDRILA